MISNALRNKYFHLSSASPIREATTESAARTINTLLEIITYIDLATTSATLARRNQNTSQPSLTTCNAREVDTWKTSLKQYHGVRGWAPPSPSCVSDVYGAGRSDGVAVHNATSLPGFSIDTVYNAVVHRSTQLDDIATRIATDLALPWKLPNRPRNFVYNIREQRCTHDYAGFVRQNGEWFLDALLTNARQDRVLDDRERVFLHEYVRADRNGVMLPSKTMRLPVLDEAAFDMPKATLTWISNSTTLLQFESGGVSAAAFNIIFAPDNPAVIDAIRKGGHDAQQAADATTPSNIAILALPLAMNIVPVALVADVNGIGMLVYTLLTDVLTAVPLAIKGVEVLAISARRQRSVVTRVTGGQVEDGAEKAGEVWVAECVANGNLKPTGVILLVVALMFMVGGVVAEFVAREWVRKKRRRAEKGAEGSEGRGMERVVSSEGDSMVIARERGIGKVVQRIGNRV